MNHPGRSLRPVSVECHRHSYLDYILRTVPVEGHGDDTPLTSHDTPLFSLLILLVHVSKFNVHDTLMTLLLRLALATAASLAV